MGNKKPGTKPKPGARFLCGKLRPTGDPIQPAAWARLRGDAAKLLKDDRLSSQVGRLSFHRELSDAQATAAFRVGAIYGNFERHKSKRRSIGSPSYERAFRGDGDIAEELMDADTLEQLERAIQASAEAFRALMSELSLYPRPVCALIETLCVDDRAIPAQDLPIVREALDLLANFFGKSGSRKRARARRPKSVTTAAAPAPTPRAATFADIDAVVLRKLMKVLRPDLDEAGLRQATEIGGALKEREIFNRKKERGQRNA